MSEGIRNGPSTLQQIENRRRSSLRTNYLVPIYVMNTSNVPPEEAQAALLGVSDVVRASEQRRQIVNFGSQSHGSGAFSSPDWYVQEAYRRQQFKRNLGFGPQVVTNGIIRLFAEEPYQQNPHWEVIVLNNDLTSGEQGINFVFGETNTSFPASVQSITRLMAEVPRGQLRLDMVRRLLRHEVGHMFGLVSRNFNAEEKLGRHCTNVCTMRQGMSTQEWAQETTEEVRNNLHFCRDCLSDLARYAPRFHPMPITTVRS